MKLWRQAWWPRKQTHIKPRVRGPGNPLLGLTSAMPHHKYFDTLLLAVVGCLRIGQGAHHHQTSQIIAGAYKALANDEPFPVSATEILEIVREVAACPLQFIAASVVAVLQVFDRSLTLPSCEDILLVSCEEFDSAVATMTAGGIEDVATLLGSVVNRETIRGDHIHFLAVNCHTPSMLSWLQIQIGGQSASAKLGQALTLLWEHTAGQEPSVGKALFRTFWDALVEPELVTAAGLANLASLPASFRRLLVNTVRPHVLPAADSPYNEGLLSKVLWSYLPAQDIAHLARALLSRACAPTLRSEVHAAVTVPSTTASPPTNSSAAVTSTAQSVVSGGNDRDRSESEEEPLVRRPRTRRPAMIPTPTPSASDRSSPVPSSGGSSTKRKRPSISNSNKRQKRAQTEEYRNTKAYTKDELYFIFAYALRAYQEGPKPSWHKCVNELEAAFKGGYDRSSVCDIHSRLKKQLYGVAEWTKAFDELVREVAEPDLSQVAAALKEKFSREFELDELRRVYGLRYPSR